MTIIAIQRLQNGLLHPIICNKIAFGGENVGKEENGILTKLVKYKKDTSPP